MNGAGTRFSSRQHWLIVDQLDPRRPIVGCHCGFAADVEEDAGYGDSVVDHIAAAVREEDIALLDEFLSSLPKITPSHEYPGVVRAIEVLRNGPDD